LPFEIVKKIIETHIDDLSYAENELLLKSEQ